MMIAIGRYWWSRLRAWAAAVLLLGTMAPLLAAGLDCGRFEFPYCKGKAAQFDPGFKPGAGYGGFGGAAPCKPARTPVVFIHGNADSAIGWDAPPAALDGFTPPPASVYDSFIAAGYRPCELYGLTWLTRAEQRRPQNNFHEPRKYELILKFIDRVKAHTGAQQVDVVAHSLGVSMTMAALSWRDAQTSTQRAWGSVRRFVNIAGGIRGLGACQAVGPANPIAPTCGSERLNDRWIFGFYPDNVFVLFGFNEWTAAGGRFSLREAPARHPEVRFYTVSAGRHDQVHCSTVHGVQDCARGPLFEAAPNVAAQLDIGAGSKADQLDFDFEDESLYVKSAGDVDGVGHFRARNQAGAILVQMLTTDCLGLACRGAYVGGPVVEADPGR